MNLCRFILLRLFSLLRLLPVSLCREYCSNIWMHSIFTECTSAIPNFFSAPRSCQPTYPFNHSHKYLDFGSKREKDWITDWHNNSRKQSGVWEAGQICGHMGWCNEKQNFLTPELCDPLKPWNPASLFLAEFPPKPHTSLNVCTHTPTTSSLLPAPTFSLTVWTFQWGQSILEALTKCHVLLVNVSLIEITAEDIDVHR